MREIEIKAKITNKTTVIKKLQSLGVRLGPPKKQHDVVFCKPGQQDYQEGSVWLRIRTENDAQVTWTLKVDTGRKLDSIEHELQVSNGHELETMLRLMGYVLYSDLTKTRQKATYNGIEICLDQVENLGTYIEAEKLCEHNADNQQVTEELWEFFAKLGITRRQQEAHGYDVLLKQKSGPKAQTLLS